MKYAATESWSVFGLTKPRLALPSPVVVRDAAWGATLHAGPRGKPRIYNAMRWKHLNWNMAIGLSTIALVSAAGWAGVFLLVSSVLDK